MNEDTQFLGHIVKGLVEHPDDVTITRSTDEMGVLLSVKVNEADMGNVIGRSGETAKSVRTLLRHYGMKKGERVSVKILEPNEKSGNYRLNRGVHSDHTA